MSTKFLDSKGLVMVLKNLLPIFNEKVMLSSYDGGNGFALYTKNTPTSYSYIYSNSYVDTMISGVTTDYQEAYTYLQNEYNKLLERVIALENKTNNTYSNDIYLSTEMQEIAYANGVSINTAVHDIPNGIPNEKDDTIMGAFAYAGILF